MPETDRYRIVPQMEVYDELPLVLAPYVTLISKPLFRSNIVNTDSNGFRVSYDGDELIDSQSWWGKGRRGIVLGGSFVFGVGATHDKHTMVSALNSLTGYSFLNLGIRAGNSTQELIASIPFLASSECVIVCSGINNLLFSLQSIGKNDLYGPLVAEETIDDLASYSIFELGKRGQFLSRTWNSVLLFGKLIALLCRRLSGLYQTSVAEDARIELGGGSDYENLSEFASEALRRQMRDLVIIANSLPEDSKLIFAAQPFAEVCHKELCYEEQRLFRATDKLQSRGWQIVKEHLVGSWAGYLSSLQGMCSKERIAFVDLNVMDLRGWSYVDRAHMTDEGYMQIAERIVKEIV